MTALVLASRSRPATCIAGRARWLAIAAACLMVLLPACGAALRKHAAIAHLAGELIDAGGAIIEARARVDEQAAVDSSGTREEARGRIDAIRRRYEPVERCYEATRQAHGAYVEAIVLAHAAGRHRLDFARATELLAVWQALLRAADALGLRIPAPPEGLSTLKGRTDGN